MAEFKWEAKQRNGKVKEGEMEADSEAQVRQRLMSQGLVPVKIKKKPKDIQLKIPGLGAKVTTRDLIIFTKQFSTMVTSGLPLVQCLDLLGKQAENPEFRRVLLEVKTSVEGGATFADSLAKHPKVFDSLFVNMVAAGEIGGVLDTIMVRISEHIEKSSNIIKRVKGAMTYPAIILVVAILATIVLMVWVIPVFQEMFMAGGNELPWPTQLMIDISQFFQDHVVAIFAVLISIVVGYKVALSTKKGRYLWDSLMLKAPIFGPLVTKMAVSSFTSTLGTMLSSGVSIIDALDIVAKASGNVVVAEGINTIKARVAEGKSIAAEMANVPIFPTMVVQMVAVGETTGAMDSMLNKVAAFYDQEVNDAVDTMMAALEPVIMGGLAVVLGGMVIAMYLPTFSMAGNM